MDKKTIAEAFRMRKYVLILDELQSAVLSRDEREEIRRILDRKDEDELYQKRCDNESMNRYWENPRIK